MLGHLATCQPHQRRSLRTQHPACASVRLDDLQPMLHPAAGDEDGYVYESCNNQQERRGSMEGTFTFVPGDMASPLGAPFNAECPKFPLDVPSFIV